MVALFAMCALVAAGCGSIPGTSKVFGTGADDVEVVDFTFHSRTLDRALDERIALPGGRERSRGRALVVFLHGRRGTEHRPTNGHFVDALDDAGRDAPVILFVNGGTASYFHDRRGAKWGTYVTRELVPDVVRRYHLDARRVVYAGISMGGYGALELTRERGRRACAVAGIAPALWLRSGDSAPGAFDDAEDYARHDVLGAVRADPNALHGTPVWLAGGDRDPFHEGTDGFARALEGGPSTVVRVRGAGGHDGDYWNPRMRPMIAWLMARLKTC